jgi:hypothetical protein
MVYLHFTNERRSMGQIRGAYSTGERSFREK